MKRWYQKCKQCLYLKTALLLNTIILTSFLNKHYLYTTIARKEIFATQQFYMHGNLLFEMKRIPEAREYLKKALRWNPASCTIGFEYIETFKAEP